LKEISDDMAGKKTRHHARRRTPKSQHHFGYIKILK